MENVIVILVVGLALVYMAHRARRAIAGRGDCGCGESSCASKTADSRGPVFRELVQLETKAMKETEPQP